MRGKALILCFCLMSSCFGEGGALPPLASPHQWEPFTLLKGGGLKKQGQKPLFFKGNLKHSRTQDPILGSEWGTRTGVDYRVMAEDWNLLAYYTRFRSQFFSSSSWQGGGTPAFRVHLNLADVEVGKRLKAKGFCAFRPHVGLRGAWIYQRAALLLKEEGEGLQRKEPVFVKNCLGVGLRGGVDTFLKITPSLRIFGDGALGWLAGYYDPLGKQTGMPEREGEEERRVGGIATAEFALGLHFERRAFARTLLSLRIGYEVNYVLNQKAESLAGGGFSLQGVQAGLRLDF